MRNGRGGTALSAAFDDVAHSVRHPGFSSKSRVLTALAVAMTLYLALRLHVRGGLASPPPPASRAHLPTREAQDRHSPRTLHCVEEPMVRAVALPIKRKVQIRTGPSDGYQAGSRPQRAGPGR